MSTSRAWLINARNCDVATMLRYKQSRRPCRPLKKQWHAGDRYLSLAHDLFAEANYLADQDLKIFAPAAMIDISGSNGESPGNPSG